MTRITSLIFAICLGLTTVASLTAQETNTVGNASIPRVIRFSGVLKEADGKPAQGTPEVVFAFYKDEQGGEPLWSETQKVTLDASGQYSVMLGVTASDGLPEQLFAAGDAWWIEARVSAAGGNGVGRMPAAASLERSLLAAVPYALKSVDSDTLAGRAAADYVTREDLHAAVSNGVQAAAQQSPSPGPAAISGTGTAGVVPVWTGASTLGNSPITVVGSSVGIGNTAPTTPLDVKGASSLRGIVSLLPSATATATTGVSSPALRFQASIFPSTSSVPVAQNFEWQAWASGNNTATASSRLELMFASGTAAPALTGLYIAPNGQINFAGGQKFPGALTGVTASSPITATTSGSNVSLGLNSSALETTLNGTYARLGADNTFTGNQAVAGNLTSTAQVSGSTINAATSFNLGGTPFAFGSLANANAFFGFAGNAAGGAANVGIGKFALQSTTGGGNTAVGDVALRSNSTGYYNSAFGINALLNNTGGQGNTAVGASALESNATGSNNTAIGNGAGSIAGALNNTTTIGAYATATVSNALVLGSINGVNGATADTLVGIGTTAPTAKLDVHGNANFTGLVTFAPNQTFPSAGAITGIITSPGSGLKGGANSGSPSLSLDTTFTDGRYAQLSANNTFSGVQVINKSVGIGMPSPVYPLHVNGVIRSESGGLSLGGFAPLSVDSNGTVGGRLAVLSNGRVGIGNAFPKALLDVGGSINAVGPISTSAGLTVNSGAFIGGNATVSGNLSIGGDTAMSAAPHMYLTGYTPGPLQANIAVSPITAVPSKNIIITRMTSGGTNTCPGSGPLSFAVYAGGADSSLLHSIDLNPYTGIVSITDSGPLSIPVAAGTPLQGTLSVPNCGSFGTAPFDISVSVEYVMQ